LAEPFLGVGLRVVLYTLPAGYHGPDEIFALGKACVDDARNMEGDEQQGAVSERATVE
jgi:hypothetical protein